MTTTIKSVKDDKEKIKIKVYDEEKEKKRKIIKVKDKEGIKKSLKHIIRKVAQINNHWLVVDITGTEFRNPSETEALEDLATVNGYGIIWYTTSVITNADYLKDNETIVDESYDVIVKVSSYATLPPSGTVVVSDGTDSNEAELIDGIANCVLVSSIESNKDITAEFLGSYRYLVSSAEPAKHKVKKEQSGKLS